MIRYAGARFAFSYPEGWTARDQEGSVSLWKKNPGGAITVSVIEASGDALGHCARFAEKHAFDPPRMSGDAETADAAFTDQDGVWCKVRILAAGSRVVMGTYHASVPDPVEEVEADGILASLRIVPG